MSLCTCNTKKTVHCHRGTNPGLPQRLFANGTLRREAGDGPHADLDATVELLASHVPNALVGHDLGLGLQGERQQKKEGDYGKVVPAYLSASSRTVRCGAKQAIAQTRISMPL